MERQGRKDLKIDSEGLEEGVPFKYPHSVGIVFGAGNFYYQIKK